MAPKFSDAVFGHLTDMVTGDHLITWMRVQVQISISQPRSSSAARHSHLPMADDIDGRMRTLSAHTGSEFEADRLGRHKRQVPNGTDVHTQVNAQGDQVETVHDQNQVGTRANLSHLPSLAHPLISLPKPHRGRPAEAELAACAVFLRTHRPACGCCISR